MCGGIRFSILRIEEGGMASAIGLSKEAWGPRFWSILHRFAEQSGRQNNAVQENDEADAWMILLKAQAHVMPCALCKNHYLEWQNQQKPELLRGIKGPERRIFLREWLWGCHERVNEMNGKPSFSLDTMPVKYPKQSVEKEFQELKTMFSLALNKLQLKVEDIHRWRQAVSRLRVMQGM